MSEPSELERVLAALDRGYAWSVETGKGGRPTTEALHDASRLLRAMAADFELRARLHPIDCGASDFWSAGSWCACTCGLDEARRRWKL